MMAALQRCVVVAPVGPARARAFRRAAGALVVLLVMAAVACASLPDAAAASEQSQPASPMAARIKALIPDLETQIAGGMKAFDVPGLAIGIVTGDRLVYAKGFGVRSKSGGASVDARTVFQIGSVTKGFLATTMAIGVDQGKFKWDDPVIDRYPDFRLKDPWVTREFRMFDLMAQRSGLPPYVNDVWTTFGIDAPALIRSLRNVAPVSSFRTTFAYTNITHLLAGRIVAERDGLPDWNAVVQDKILNPLGMTETTYSADAIGAAADHAQGYRYTPDGSIQVPFIQLFPYDLGGAGDINSSVEDMAHWLRLQLGKGSFEGRRVVSPEKSRCHTHAKGRDHR